MKTVQYILSLLLIVSNVYSETKDNHIFKNMGSHHLYFIVPNDIPYKIKSNNHKNNVGMTIESNSIIVEMSANFTAKNKNYITVNDLNNIVTNSTMKSMEHFIEKKLIFKSFDKINSTYVELTDKTLKGKKIKKGDWKYFTTGAISNNNILFNFFILTNDIKSKEYISIIKMFNNSFFVQSSTLKDYYKYNKNEEANNLP